MHQHIQYTFISPSGCFTMPCHVMHMHPLQSGTIISYQRSVYALITMHKQAEEALNVLHLIHEHDSWANGTFLLILFMHFKDCAQWYIEIECFIQNLSRWNKKSNILAFENSYRNWIYIFFRGPRIVSMSSFKVCSAPVWIDSSWSSISTSLLQFHHAGRKTNRRIKATVWQKIWCIWAIFIVRSRVVLNKKIPFHVHEARCGAWYDNPLVYLLADVEYLASSTYLRKISFWLAHI